MVVKECFRCHELKPLSEFYRHPMMGDGHLGKCKACTRRDVGEHRANNLEKVRAYDCARARQPHRRRKAQLVVERRYREAPNMERAHRLTHNAIRSGKLVRNGCEVCGTANDVHAHHDDYLRPLDVHWLCAAHHSQWHIVNGEGKNAA